MRVEARAGCIPFVHDSGGQVEIVGQDSRLCFNEETASERLRRFSATKTCSYHSELHWQHGTNCLQSNDSWKKSGMPSIR